MNRHPIRYLALIAFSLTCLPALAGVVGTITRAAPDSQEITIDGTTYKLAPGVKIMRDGRPNETLTPSRLTRGQAIHYDLDHGTVSVIRLLDKPVTH